MTVPAGATVAVKLDPSTTPALHLQNPKLWWPTGYGDPNLYKVDLTFETADKKVSDIKSFQAGVRQMTYTEDARLRAGGAGGVQLGPNIALRIYINGRRFIGRGGNWGFPEVLLRYRAA